MSDIVLSHLGLNAVTGALHVLDGVLDLVSGGNVLPSVQEGLLLHVSFTNKRFKDTT